MYDRYSDILVPIPEDIKNAIQPTTDDEVAALYSGLGKTLYERISSALERDAYSLGNTRLAILPLKPSYDSQIIDTQVFGTKAPLIDYVGTEANLTPGEDHIIVVGIPVGGSTDSSLSDSFYEELSDVLSQILDETDPDFDSDKDDIYI